MGENCDDKLKKDVIPKNPDDILVPETQEKLDDNIDESSEM